MKYAIGIDIGGTKISMVIGSARGRIIARRQIPTLKHSKARDGLRLLADETEAMIGESGLSKSRLAGIGMGIPGAVNGQKGLVPKSPNLQGWAGLPVKKILTQRFRKPVWMTNDANAAVMGEKIFGAGRGKQHLIYLTISTGVGGGVVSHNRLLEGSQYAGAELGHMTIIAKGNACNCGQKGCLEAYASGTAITKYAEGEIRKGRGAGLKKKLSAVRGISGIELGKAAGEGNPLAREAYRRGGYYLGIGIGSLLNIFNPELVILGGGVLKSAPKEHWQAMLKSAKAHAWAETYRSAKIVRTRLGDDVGNLGALALVFAGTLGIRA